MRTLPTRAALAALAVTMSVLGWPHSHGAAIAGEQPEGTARLSEELSIYLGCGAVEGPGTVVQLDAAGRDRGTVQLSDTPYGLAVRKQDLVAALPSYKKPGRIVSIDAKGGAQTIFQDTRMPHPIAIAVDPRSQDILVADNDTDVLLLLPGGEPKSARKELRIKGQDRELQEMPVALADDGRILLGMTGSQGGIYRFPANKDAALGQPLLPYFGRVAADPSSGRWVAALTPQMTYRGQELRIFEKSRETQGFPFPAGQCNWHDSLGFGPDGTLVIAFCHTKYLGADLGYQVVREDISAYEVVVVDFTTKAFRRLFAWNKSRIVSLAVGPKMAWRQ